MCPFSLTDSRSSAMQPSSSISRSGRVRRSTSVSQTARRLVASARASLSSPTELEEDEEAGRPSLRGVGARPPLDEKGGSAKESEARAFAPRTR
eukprot:scaffold284773_cov31-Tisochrysis_lutea.AAC.1